MNEEYIKIAKKSAYPFVDKMSNFDLIECIYNGISEAVSTFDDKLNVKITSHIYNRVRYACLNFIKNRKNYVEITSDFSDNEEENTYQTKFDPKFTEILIDKYVYKLPIEFIAEKYNLSIDEARYRIRKRKKIFKRLILAEKLFKK